MSTVLPAQNPVKYWIQFTDKNNSSFSIAQPETFLSPRAIARRNKNKIAFQENDLPVNSFYIDSVLSTGVTLINKSKWFNAITISTADSTVLTKINSLSFVFTSQKIGKYIRKDYGDIEYTPMDASKTVAPMLINQINTMDYGQSLNQIEMVNGECLHNDGFKGEGMVIAVLDAGFLNINTLPAFDSLWANRQILGTRDFVSGDSLVFEDNSHGMMVLSVMAANLPGKLIGTAPKANYWLLRTEDAGAEYIGEEDNWIAGAEFADSVGADIINTSLGYDTFDDASQNHTYADMNGNTARITIAADIAVSKGVLVVCSAGNEGNSKWKYISAPADGDSVLTVGAVDATRNYATFSSMGPSYDGRIKPDIAAQGQATVFASTSGDVQTGNGTSFSSPLIAGMMACLWQANPNSSAMELINVIQQSADQAAAPDFLKGYGVPNFCVANSLLSGIQPQEFTEDNLMKLFPIPCSNSLEFSFYSFLRQTITIDFFDIRGRSIKHEEKTLMNNSLNNYTITDLEGLDRGVYILNITSANKVYTRKVLKI